MNTYLIGALTTLVLAGVVSLGLSSMGQVCLFSGMSGVITNNGEPVAGARITRTVKLTREQSDETTTDEQGRFAFAPVFARTATKHLPQEFASNQDLVVHHDGDAISIWSSVKRTPEENSESRGKPLVVTCELTSEERMLKVNNSPIFTRCTWDVEPDEKRSVF
ncbi:MAG: DUF6795 domain-containing protein [Pseudomonadota bacterium]